MHPNRFLLTVFATLALVASVHPQTKEYTIAIVSDGDSWYFDRNQQLLVEELQSLARDKYSLKIKDEFKGNYDGDEIGQLLRQALADPEVDLIYTSGVISSERASKMPEAERTKPVLAGAVFFSDARTQKLTEQGASTRPNYTFISEPNRVAADLMQLKNLTGAATIHIAVDDAILPELAEIQAAQTMFQAALGVTIRVHAIPPSPKAALSKIPAGALAVYVPILARMDEDARREFYTGLASRGAVTMTMAGHEDVLLGAVAGLAPDDKEAVARRAAINVDRILLGANTNTIPVVLPVQDRFVINAAAAQRANWSPTYDTMLEAELIGEFGVTRREPISLHDAMKIAARQNSDVIIAREEEGIQAQETNIIRSGLLPQISSDIAIQRSETDDPTSSTPGVTEQTLEAAGLGGGATTTRSYGADLRQVLFNDQLTSGLKAQRKNELATKLDTTSTELDAMDSASGAYFDYLEANALYQIEKQNLRLSQNNLQLAQLRVDIGSAEPSEIYRWQQSVARDKATLIQRKATREINLTDFNRTLALPRDAQWDFTDIELDDGDIYFLDEQLSPLLNNLSEFHRFRSFILWYATENSPELASFDETLSAQGIILRQRKRSFFMPEISASAGYDRLVLETNQFDLDGQDELNAGISFSYSIFEGGNRRAELLQQKGQIRQLAAQREQAVQQIETGAIIAFENLGSAHPNIRLSRMSLEAASKNYDSVREKYAQGGRVDSRPARCARYVGESAATRGVRRLHVSQRGPRASAINRVV